MKIKVLTNQFELNDVINIHLSSFKESFLTSMGRRFLQPLYEGFFKHSKSNIICAYDDDNNIIGFLAYSKNLSELYRFIIKKNFFKLTVAAGIAIIHKPYIIVKLLRAMKSCKEEKIKENFISISSIAVSLNHANQGTGTQLINYIKQKEKKSGYKSIKLETDGKNNDAVNQFYLKNQFILTNSYVTNQGRQLNEYQYFL